MRTVASSLRAASMDFDIRSRPSATSSSVNSPRDAPVSGGWVDGDDGPDTFARDYARDVASSDMANTHIGAGCP